jgi:putative ABC transport system permease protein
MQESRRGPAWRRYLRFWGSNIAADVDDELRFHIEMRVSEYIARGMSPDEAQRRAAQRVGDVSRAREECIVVDERFARSEGRAQVIGALRQDVVFASRLLRRQRLPSAVAVVCLALGIGASTTMFSVGNTLLLHPLPYPNGDRVVSVLTKNRNESGPPSVSSYLDFADWRVRAHAFSEMGAIGATNFTFLLSAPLRATGGIVTPGFFRVLGIRAESGRLFMDDDDRPGAPKLMVVSHTFAEQRLGGAASVVGKMFTVGGVKRLVIGVIPDRWQFPSGGQVWMPPLLGDYNKQHRGNRNIQVYALPKPNMTIDAARRDMDAITTALAVENPGDDSYVTTVLEPLRERFVGPTRTSLIALSCAALLVLLVACANVAALQVARALTRALEIAVRTALGAGRVRIVRQLLTESVLLAIAGGALGVGIARVGTDYVARAIARGAPPWMTFGVDTRALVFTLVVSMLIGVAFGVAPALRLSRTDPGNALRGGQGALGFRRGSLQRAFVVSEIAMSVVLVIGAALAIESVIRLRNVPLGVDPAGVLSFRLSLQGPRYDSTRERGRAMSDFEHRIAAIPGVESVGATTYVPLVGCCSQFGTQIEGRTTDAAHMMMVTGNMITPGFFRSTRVPLIAGREFSDADDADAPKVIIINETFAIRFWPAGDAIGHRIDTGNGMSTIVGIVGDIKQASITNAAEPQFYRPHLQDPWTAMTFTVRVRGNQPERIMPDVRRAMTAIDPTLPVYGVRTLENVLTDAIASPRMFGILYTAFAAVALLLATAGVYATMSFFVSQRTRELGLRVALGAEPRAVVRMIMRQGALLAVIGGIVGLALGSVAARALAHTLYGVSAREPLVYAVASAVLVVAATVASYGPARRASAIDPMIALRTD